MNEFALANSAFVVESRIGGGGGGAVYKAWHKRLRMHVAVKMFVLGQSSAKEPHRTEVEALENVESVYLPQVHDYITESGRAFIVMDYVEGESFENLLVRGQRFSDLQCLAWYAQLATALDTLHKNNVCHRDIKPSNIILTPSGSIRLIDFGAAIVGGKSPGFAARSPGYASPEQYEAFEQLLRLRSRKHLFEAVRFSDGIDWKRSDIYSLGATMYHIFSGTRPHEKAAEVTALSSYRRHGATVARVIKRSMHPDPSVRFKSAAEVMDALNRTRGLRLFTSMNLWRSSSSKDLSYSRRGTSLQKVGSIVE